MSCSQGIGGAAQADSRGPSSHRLLPSQHQLRGLRRQRHAEANIHDDGHSAPGRRGLHRPGRHRGQPERRLRTPGTIQSQRSSQDVRPGLGEFWSRMIPEDAVDFCLVLTIAVSLCFAQLLKKSSCYFY